MKCHSSSSSRPGDHSLLFYSSTCCYYSATRARRCIIISVLLSGLFWVLNASEHIKAFISFLSFSPISSSSLGREDDYYKDEDTNESTVSGISGIILLQYCC